MFWKSKFFHAYYIVNGFVLFLYPLYRQFVNPHLTTILEDSIAGYNREYQIFLTLGIFIVVKFFRSTTRELFVSRALLYSKVAMILVFFLNDKRLGIWYLIICVVLWVILKEPKYSGPSKIEEIQTDQDFYKRIQDNRQAKSQDIRNAKMWVMIFYADWCDSCIHTESMWAELSLTYTTPQLKFAKINVVGNESLAKKLKIDTSGLSRQLPSLVLFENGKEAVRFPPIDKSGRVGRVLKYKKKEIVKYLELDKRFLATSKVTAS